MEKIPRPFSGKYILYASIIFNLIVLDWVFLKKFNESLVLTSNTAIVSNSNRNNQIELVPTPTIIYYQTTPTQVPVSADSKTVKEVYVPIGSGSTSSSSWDRQDGVEVNIDLNKHGYIREAYFQATLRIPTANGEVHAKLFNETEKHDVWFSEVVSQGADGNLKEAKISLSPGANLYRIYLKSTLEAPAVLDFARLKLIIEE